jgi:hypothetical protein
MPRRKSPSKTPMADLTVAQEERLRQIERDAFLNFEGEFDELEKALGILRLGHHVGWKPIVLIHSKKTVAKYEEILGIRLRDEFPDVGPSADRSFGYRVAKKLANFWKAVSGETPVEDRQRFTKGTAEGS